MCGISAIIGRENIVPALFESIRNLEYRGYDSCGLAVVDGGELHWKKHIGGVDEVNKKVHLTTLNGQMGIAHTRWATHGRVEQRNAHPHLDFANRFAIVHNGIINNYQDLREALERDGIQFASDTDTEVLAHLIGQAYAKLGQVEEAFLAALNQLDGSYAVAMVTGLEPDKLYCVRQGSPLVLGLDKARNFAASDVNAFLPYTHQAIFLEDGEYAVLTAASHLVRKVKDRSLVERPVTQIQWDAETSKKGGYSHYMLKEIFDQPQTVRNALMIAHEEIEAVARAANKAPKVFLAGVGTTYYVSLYGQYLFSQLAGVGAQAISSDEFNELAVVGKDDLVLAVSQSGETYDTRVAMEAAQKAGGRTAAVVNVMGSTLSRMVDLPIMQGSGPEICVVSTKAALAQMVILQRIALELGVLRGKLTPQQHKSQMAALEALPPLLERTLNESSGFLRNLSEQTARYQNWLFMGRGLYYPIAMEAALKMKEVSYLHVEGMPAGFLKHGTLAMIDEQMATLFFVPPMANKQLHHQTLAAMEEVKARSGPIFGFAFENDPHAIKLLDGCVALPPMDEATAPLMEMVMAQLFSYFTALRLGRAIDKPRNLAKSVTVG